MKPVYLSVLLLLFICSKINAIPGAVTTYAASPISFIENRGQLHDQYNNARPDIRFAMATGDMNVFIGEGAIHYQFCKLEKPDAALNDRRQADEIAHAEPVYSYYRMDVTLVGANRHAVAVAEEKQNYYERYFTPGTGDKGVTAAAYNKITFKEVYPHIDWVLYSKNGVLKHEFVVRNGGRTSDIKLRYSGATGLSLNPDGSIVAVTPQGTITEHAPHTYQMDGKIVASKYKLEGSTISYETGAYAGDLIIDPTIVWGTYYGGTGTDNAVSTTVDISGNVYLFGSTNSAGLATAGAHMTTTSGSDMVLVQFNSAGVRQWATYYGGASGDDAADVKTDIAGNVYITGGATSSTGIATAGSHDPSWGGSSQSDMFLAKFDNTGLRLWGTYYGGTNAEHGSEIAIDGLGFVYVTGTTFSTGSISTAGAHQTALASSMADAFLVKFSSSGVRQWGTYFGRTSFEEGYAVAVDASDNVYIAGTTQSTSGIATTGAHQTTYGGGQDAYLVKFNSAGVRLWSTYYGGSSWEMAHTIATDSYGNVYTGGEARSTAGVATAGAHQSVYGGGTSTASDGYLVKFDSTGTRLWATYYGGPVEDEIRSIVVNGPENVYVAGFTESTSGIGTAGGYLATLVGMRDIFFAKFNGSGTRQWGSYYGGAAADNIGKLTIAPGGIYLCGATNSASGIATAGAHQVVKSSTQDGFLVKFNDCLLPDPGVIAGHSIVCIGAAITLTNGVTTGTWSASNANATVSSTGLVTGVTAGLDTIRYTTTNACGTTVATKVVTVSAAPTSISGPVSVCVSYSVALTGSGPGGTWSSSAPTIAIVGSGTGSVTGIAAGTAVITYAIPGCFTTRVITVNPLPAAIAGTMAICPGATTTLTSATAGGTWSGTAPTFFSIGSTSGLVTGIAAGAGVVSYRIPTGCFVIAVFTVNPIPAATVGPTTVCVGATVTLTNATSGGTWASGTAAATVGSGTGVVTGVAGGTAIISYILPTGCYRIHTITVNPVPAAIAGTFLLCPGSSTTLTSATGGGSWTSGTTSVATVGAATGIASGVIAGTTNITYTITSGCRAVATLTVDVAPAPIAGSLSTCPGSATTLTNTVAGGTWTSGTAGVATIGAGTGIVSGITPGTSVITYALASGCGDATVTVTVHPLPPPVTGTMTVCMGSTTSLAVAATGGTWSSGTTGVATVGATSGIVLGIGGGTAGITYTATSGCKSVATVTVLPPADITGSTFVCVGSTVLLTSSSAGGTWSVDVPAVATIGAATGIVTGITTGSTTITYVPPSGCTNTSVISVYPVPVAIAGLSSVCAGSSISLSSATIGGTWSSSDAAIATVSSTGDVTGVSGGTATISYIHFTTCFVTAVVTVDPLPDPGTITGPDTVCIGETITLTASVAGGSWDGSNSNVTVAGGVVTGLIPGAVTISYIYTNSCGTASATRDIIVSAAGDCISVAGNLKGNEGAFICLPNPNNGSFTIKLLSRLNEEVNVVIYDVIGRSVLEFNTATNVATPVKLSHPAGIYVLSASTSTGRYVTKMVKE